MGVDPGGAVHDDLNEYAYTAALDDASERVRVVEIGRTIHWIVRPSVHDPHALAGRQQAAGV